MLELVTGSISVLYVAEQPGFVRVEISLDSVATGCAPALLEFHARVRGVVQIAVSLLRRQQA